MGMDNILQVTAKFRCVVRVVVTVPGEAGYLRNPSGSYGLRLTLEDPTARIHAYLHSEDAVCMSFYKVENIFIKLPVWLV